MSSLGYIFLHNKGFPVISFVSSSLFTIYRGFCFSSDVPFHCCVQHPDFTNSNGAKHQQKSKKTQPCPWPIFWNRPLKSKQRSLELIHGFSFIHVSFQNKGTQCGRGPKFCLGSPHCPFWFSPDSHYKALLPCCCPIREHFAT